MAAVRLATAWRGVRWGAMLLAGAIFAACAANRIPSAPPPPFVAAPVHRTSVVGVASWYGPGFNGHRTSSGAIYNQDDLTAASTVFPLGSRLRVTNLGNGESVDVTVNDHGPYVKGRDLDLSRLAARRIGIIGSGAARVRMVVLKTPAGGPALGERYYVQVGSFADWRHADRVRARLEAKYRDVGIETVDDSTARYYRVRMGSFESHQDATARATRMIRLGYRAFVITE